MNYPSQTLGFNDVNCIFLFFTLSSSSLVLLLQVPSVSLVGPPYNVNSEQNSLWLHTFWASSLSRADIAGEIRVSVINGLILNPPYSKKIKMLHVVFSRTYNFRHIFFTSCYLNKCPRYFWILLRNA
jgi:hypothetical protein